MIVVSDKLSTESFHAFIDEQLTDEQYVQVEQQLDEIPEKVEEIQQCQIINERLREVFDPIVEEDMPQDLFELALYGVISEQEQDSQDYQQYGYEYDEGLNAITGYEDEIISPMDSMDSALELQDEEFIDDNEFADIEALSGQEGMADFDIDAIRNDNNNIIPDIFDNEGDQLLQNNLSPQAQLDSSPDDEAMLDSIESLSLEPLEAEDASAAGVSSDLAPTESATETEYTEHAGLSDTTEGIDVPELELQPLDQAEDVLAQSEFADQAANIEIEEHESESLTEQQAAKERVLETLEASEELSLEPLQSEQGAETVQQPGVSDQAEVPEVIALPADEESIDKAEEVESETQTRHVLGGGGNGELPTEGSDVLEVSQDEAHAELFAETASTTEIEAESSYAQPPVVELEESLFSSTEDSLKPENDTPATSEYPIDEIVQELDEIPNGDKEAPQDVVAEFFAENKAEPDFEVSEVVKQFEEASDEFGQHHHQDPFGSPVSQIKQKADGVLNVINNKFFALKNTILKKEESPFPDFNEAPDFTTPSTTQVPPGNATEQHAVSDVNDSQTPFDFDIGVEEEPVAPVSRAEQSAVKPANESQSPFEFDFGEAEESKTDGFSRKIGDTLKSYKEKIAQQKQKSADAGEAAFEIGNQIVPHEEAATGFLKYKKIAADAIEKVSPENRMTIGGVILLVIGLIVGGSTASLFDATASVISNDKVERLAIDAHILYTQQNQNFAGNPSTSITESMQWLSARIGRHIRLADVQLEEFKHQRAIIMPTMVSYATANIFENRNKEKITLFIAANAEGVANSPLTCRIPSGVDGLCTWVKDSMYFVAVANLSLSRVRAFSQELVEKL